MVQLSLEAIGVFLRFLPLTLALGLACSPTVHERVADTICEARDGVNHQAELFLREMTCSAYRGGF